MSDTYRSDPKRAAELAVILATHAMRNGMEPAPHKVATAIAEMQAAARSAKRWGERTCNEPMDDATADRGMNRVHKAQAKLNARMVELFSTDNVDVCPTIELGGDPRGPCARLHIPGQRGDGWGDGFAVY